MSDKPAPPDGRAGRVTCPYCQKPLNDGRPTTSFVGTIGHHVMRRGHSYRRDREATITWHTACMDEFDASQARLKRESAENTLKALRMVNEEIKKQGGVPFTEAELREKAGLE